MNITTIKTQKITPEDKDLLVVLDAYLPRLAERSIVVITSKIVSICEGNVDRIDGRDKKQLITDEADVVLGNKNNADFVITLKNGVLTPTAGIDFSDDSYIVLPKDPQGTARRVANRLRERFSLSDVGVLITDSKSQVLRRGTMGYAIGYSGFCGLKDYKDPNDTFQTQKSRKTLSNQVDALAAAAVAVMGEGSEQTPLATIEGLPFIVFRQDSPTQIELQSLLVKPEDDVFLANLETLRKK